MKFHITPHTKVIDLLENYPYVEDYLIELVPAFSKLKNPILRRTVGKLATIEQAAKVAEVELPFLINSLNEKLGLLPQTVIDSSKNEISGFEIDESKVLKIINADEIIAAGSSPLGEVMNNLRSLEKDNLLLLNCSFHPAPLIDKAKEAGFRAMEVKNQDKSFSIYFSKFD
ncbi:MAG: DUF1858 domain-containing protein [Candidatus Kapabacteria bacterium]|nr:DUF1858 domain-containing protein [Ignavibacteriota bacterium]MCW5885868.1 DUF1858 domain-containing protein [Candidatus Kapabacteria bacterium]